ncbi:MAG: DUF5107 domain-containing protein [Verrucomicrobia bacterium]|nr:DUF5107 domain-containing protein [Verrucomicrobiota bacterium]
MIQIRETIRTLPFHRPVPLTPLPLLYHREHLFPYTSYGDTRAAAVPRAFRMVVLENAALRVEVAPELGGRVYSLFDKRLGKEILFSNPVVKPVRILPIWVFISGGIEFNFPIAHSPTSITEVGCATGRMGDYGFIRVGEREARTGMEWVVELGLMADQPFLIQRTALRNQTGAAHPWMMWTICAVRSTSETEFIHPPHRVLVHDDRVVELDWPGDGLNWDRHYRQMTALFWQPGSAPQFGAFHHDLGFGLMHLADPAQLPGKKLWTYGHGAHRAWGQATTEGGLAYCEIESGPLLDQSEKSQFPPGATQRYTEFWIPVHSRAACDRVKMPSLKLPEWLEPWLGWKHSAWQTEWEDFRENSGPLPSSTVPTGIALEAALRRELVRSNPKAAEPLALWLAFHNRPKEALSLMEHSSAPTACRLAGLILAKALQDSARAIPFLEAGPLEDPLAVVELDELYAGLGLIDKRVSLLAKSRSHGLVIERRADLALALGRPEEALQLLASTQWPREHQRYVRTTLWKRARSALGLSDAEVPEALNEDNLAQFGAYWSDQ